MSIKRTLQGEQESLEQPLVIEIPKKVGFSWVFGLEQEVFPVSRVLWEVYMLSAVGCVAGCGVMVGWGKA